jgi:hypothetical protein
MRSVTPAVSRVHRRAISALAVAFLVLALTSVGEAQQVVYYSPVIAAPVVTPAAAYVTNYVPTGNYASVTAYSPPVVTAMPTSSVAVRSYYAPAPVVTTAAYAPAVTPAVVTPVTTYYAPAAVAVPVYRRGLFGRYRPAGAAFVPAY